METKQDNKGKELMKKKLKNRNKEHETNTE